MATAKIILKQEKAKSNGEIPLYLRIIKDRKVRFISLGYSLDPKHWNAVDKVVRKSHPNAAWMNNFLAKKLSDAQKVSLELETTSEFVPSKSIKQAILGKSTGQFIAYANLYIADLEKRGKIGTYDKAKATISKLDTYIGKKDFTYSDITYYFLKKYEKYLREDLENSVNTIHSNMKVIRRILNEAINDELLPSEKNPFIKYKLKWDKVEKIFLREDELKALEDLELVEGSKKYHHRNIYVFAAYAGGLRIGDICQLKWENFDGERILVNTSKGEGSIVSIKLPDKALEIITLYKNEEQQPNQYVFPFLENDIDYSENPKQLFRAISSMTAYTNTDLKDLAKSAEINPKLNFNSSRHTFATRALKKGMRIEYVSKLMGHTSIKTTQIYVKIVNADLDEAMDVFKSITLPELKA